MRIVLSPRQHEILEILYDLDGHLRDFRLSIAEARRFDQRLVGFLLKRGYLSFRKEEGFYLTPEGRAAYEDFHAAPARRKNPNAPLTAWFYAHYLGNHSLVRGRAQ